MDKTTLLKENILYDLLFFDKPKVKEVAEQIRHIAMLFVGVIFVLSALWEFFTENRYKELIIRTILCLIICSTYEKFLTESIKVSFSVSNKILQKYSKNNPLIKGFAKAKIIAEKKTKKSQSKDKLLGNLLINVQSTLARCDNSRYMAAHLHYLHLAQAALYDQLLFALYFSLNTGHLLYLSTNHGIPARGLSDLSYLNAHSTSRDSDFNYFGWKCGLCGQCPRILIF